MREAQVAARLHHPGIVAVHDVVQGGGAPWIVMEFLAGPSPAQVLDREERLPWKRVAALGADLAEALHAALVIGLVVPGWLGPIDMWGQDLAHAVGLV